MQLPNPPSQVITEQELDKFVQEYLSNALPLKQKTFNC